MKNTTIYTYYTYQLMNIKQLLMLLLIVFSSLIYAQNASTKIYTPSDLRNRNTYADAKKMFDIYNRIDNKSAQDSLKRLLSFYNWSIHDSDNYLLDHLLNLKLLLVTGKGLDNVSTTINQGYSSSVANEQYSGNPESIAINAIATFMANRAKEEVLYYAIDKIFDIVNDSGRAGQIFRQLVPKTTKLIIKLKKGGVYYVSDFSLIKQTMEMDLRDLPLTLSVAIKSPVPLVNDIEILTGQSYLMVRDGKRIQDLIGEWGNYNWSDSNFKITAHYMLLVSNALKDVQGSKHYWIDASEVSSLNPKNINTDNFEQFYYGLLYQQLKSQPEQFMKSICQGMNSLDDVVKFCNKLSEINSVAQEMNSLKDSLSLLKKPRQVDINWIINRVNQTINIFSGFTKLNIFSDSLSIPDSYMAYADQVIDMSRLIYQKDYASALSSLIVDLSQDNFLTETDLRKITFFIQLSQVKDESEFTAFLESYAAPIGSSSLKRTAKCNISLNGYVGLNGGYEWVTNSSTGNKNNGYYGGVAAPIGISFSFAPSKCGSVSLFLSFIDLGSLVNMRLNNDSTTYTNLKLDQFFSPGVGLYYNIKGTPLTIGGYLCRINDVLNIQYSSGTSTITETGRDVVRLNFSALIDIPFFTLRNKPQ